MKGKPMIKSFDQCEPLSKNGALAALAVLLLSVILMLLFRSILALAIIFGLVGFCAGWVLLGNLFTIYGHTTHWGIESPMQKQWKGYISEKGKRTLKALYIMVLPITIAILFMACYN